MLTPLRIHQHLVLLAIVLLVIARVLYSRLSASPEVSCLSECLLLWPSAVTCLGCLCSYFWVIRILYSYLTCSVHKFFIMCFTSDFSRSMTCLGSHYVAFIDFKLRFLPPQLPSCRDYRCAPPSPASFSLCYLLRSENLFLMRYNLSVFSFVNHTFMS